MPMTLGFNRLNTNTVDPEAQQNKFTLLTMKLNKRVKHQYLLHWTLFLKGKNIDSNIAEMQRNIGTPRTGFQYQWYIINNEIYLCSLIV
jgi:hypothetical protein